MVKTVLLSMTMAIAAAHDSSALLQVSAGVKRSIIVGQDLSCPPGGNNDEKARQIALQAGRTIRDCDHLDGLCTAEGADAWLQFVKVESLGDGQDVSALIRDTCPKTCCKALRNPIVMAKKAVKNVAKQEKYAAKEAKLQAKEALHVAMKLKGEGAEEKQHLARIDVLSANEAVRLAKKKVSDKKMELQEARAARAGEQRLTCTKVADKAVYRNYLTNGDNVLFKKHKTHPAPFTHVYEDVSECEDKCFAISSCAGFVDNRNEGYCVFKEAMVMYDKAGKDSWTCTDPVFDEPAK